MIIDGETVITGSFNFTKASEEKNAENLLIIRDKALARRYLENWQQHAAHSEPYTGKQKRGSEARGTFSRSPWILLKSPFCIITKAPNSRLFPPGRGGGG